MQGELIQPKLLPQFFIELHRRFGDFLVLRYYQNLPVGFQNDIDVFVPPTDVRRFIMCINTMKNIDCRLHVDEARYGLLKCTLSLGGDQITFDILYGFYYAGLSYQRIDVLKDLAVRHDSSLFQVPRIEDEVAISVLKELLHNKRVRADKAHYIRDALSKCSFRDGLDLFSDDDKRSIMAAISDGRLNITVHACRVILRLARLQLREEPVQFLKRIVYFFIVKYWNKKYVPDGPVWIK